MGYDYIRLTKNTSNLCTSILTWGNYKYKQLPMGVRDPPDSFQYKMNTLFQCFDFIQYDINYMFVLTSGDWNDHLNKL